MEQLNVFERLARLSPDTEVWWDSSPLVYSSWSRKFLKEAPDEKRALWEEQLQRMFDPKRPEETIFKGVTTNPPLSLQAIQADEEFWGGRVDELIDENPGIIMEDLFWLTYKDVVRRGSEIFMPVFERSEHRYGYISGQVDPRDCYDYDRMLSQSLELVELGPNVMIKCPGTTSGYRVIKELTARGIATNNTLSFTIPQFLACAKAVKEGLEIANQRGVSLGRWRSVITSMTARYGHLGDLQRQADQRGIELKETDIRYAELAIFKKASRILKERNYPSKMLICSMRFGPTIDGVKRLWHIEELAGGDIVFTCPPGFIRRVMEEYDHIELQDRMDAEVPGDVIEKLLRLPYFEKAYYEDGLCPDEFDYHSALLATAREFSIATQSMVDFVGNRLEQKVGKTGGGE